MAHVVVSRQNGFQSFISFCFSSFGKAAFISRFPFLSTAARISPGMHRTVLRWCFNGVRLVSHKLAAALGSPGKPE